mgnify:CR=1 FL=1
MRKSIMRTIVVFLFAVAFNKSSYSAPQNTDSTVVAVDPLISYLDSMSFELMKRDIRLRYRQTALGVIWVVLQPLLGAIIFSVVGKAARLPVGDVPMLAYSFASLLAWNLSPP